MTKKNYIDSARSHRAKNSTKPDSAAWVDRPSRVRFINARNGTDMSDLYSVLRPPPSPVASILVAVGVKNPNNPLAFLDDHSRIYHQPDPELLGICLRRGKNVNTHDDEGNSVLHIAVQKTCPPEEGMMEPGETELAEKCVDMLLEAGANPLTVKCLPLGSRHRVILKLLRAGARISHSPCAQSSP